MGTRDPWLIMLIPYFGTWPPWINFFMASCRANPDVVWRFYTDCGRPENLPDNVTIVEQSFADYVAFASARLDMALAALEPYKLCDLKPALGYVHERDIAGFEFFGFGDIDVIYGSISSFYPPRVRQRFDVFSSHANDVSGHFCLLRNMPAYRELYRRIPGFRKELGNPRYRALDERGLTRALAATRMPKAWLRPWRWFGVTPWPRVEFREQFSTVLSVRGWIDGTLDYPTAWRWRNGSLTTDRSEDREFLYLHFMRWKSLRYVNERMQPGEGAWLKLERLITIDWRQAAAEGFSISADGFGPYDHTPAAAADAPQRAV